MESKKGSPRDYTAGIDCWKQPTQKSRLGEPHECYPLYRIGRTQENHQLLHEDSSGPDCERGHVTPYQANALIEIYTVVEILASRSLWRWQGVLSSRQCVPSATSAAVERKMAFGDQLAEVLLQCVSARTR
jgi:hypothetical protein